MLWLSVDRARIAPRQWIACDRVASPAVIKRPMRSRQTALGRLLRERREAAGYSRNELGAILGIKRGTIEGWEVGRVTRPPLHDIVRIAAFLRIPPADLEQAVFADAGHVPSQVEGASGVEQRGRTGGPRRREAVPLLEAAFRLFGWKDEAEAAAALSSSPETVRSWRAGTRRMEFAEFLTLTSAIGVAAAAALRGDDASIADLAAAAAELGLGASDV